MPCYGFIKKLPANNNLPNCGVFLLIFYTLRLCV